MPDLLKKKTVLIASLLVVLLTAYGIYIRTDSYQFNNAKNSGDYWMLWRFMNENRTSEKAREAHLIALDQLAEATRSNRVFNLLFDRGRAAAEEDYERLAYLNEEDGNPFISYVSGSLKPTWRYWDEFELYLIVKHYLKFKELDNSNKNAQMIKDRIGSIVNYLDVREILFLDQLEFVIDMSNVSGIEPSGNSVKLLDRKISAYIENIAERPLNKNSDRLWQRINWAIREYTFKGNLKSQLSAKKLERMKDIHSEASIKLNEKIDNLIKEYEELLKIDSTYNWTPLYYALLEHDDRIALLERATEEYEEVKISLAEAEKALSEVSRVTVDILGKIEGNLYEGLIAGQLRIVLMVPEELTQIGNYHFYITLISSTSGYINKFTNMPMPLYSQYMGDYEALRKERSVQLESKKNMDERVKIAEENLRELDRILIDLFERLVNNKLK